MTLTGTLPPELGRLSGLRLLDLSHNLLLGKFPPEIADLTNLEVLELRSTLLHDCLPSEWKSLSNLTTLTLPWYMDCGPEGLPEPNFTLSEIAGCYGC